MTIMVDNQNPRFNKPMRADERERILKSDPEYQAMRQRLDRDLELRMAELRKAQEPIVQDLRRAGVRVASVWDLVNSPGPYPNAIPVLGAHLAYSYPIEVKDGIIRALATKDAIGLWNVMLSGYREEREDRLRDAYAVAISVIGKAKGKDGINTIIELLRDSQNGSSRVLFVRTASRSKSKAVEDLFKELLTDPEVGKEVEIVLRNRARRQKE